MSLTWLVLAVAGCRISPAEPASSNPPEGAGDAAVDAAGWFHTGDRGHLDGEGFLFVSGRKSERLINADGRSIVAQPIESALAARLPLRRALVIANGRPYVTALLAPDLVACERLFGVATPAQIERSTAASSAIAAAVAVVNATLRGHEQIKRWALLPQPLSAEAGELTATGKLRRHRVLARNAQLIESLYRPQPARPRGRSSSVALRWSGLPTAGILTRTRSRQPTTNPLNHRLREVAWQRRPY